MYYVLELINSAGNSQTSGSSSPANKRWNLMPPSVVGRGDDASIILDDPSISRRHCRFTTNAQGALVVQDLGSTNGIYVRDERVKSAPIIVGETFEIGGLMVRVNIVDQPLPESSSAASNASLYETQKVSTFHID